MSGLQLRRKIGRQALVFIVLARLRAALFRRSPTAAAGGPNFQAIAGVQFDADLLGAQHARHAPLRQQTIAMRRAVLAAEHAAGPIPHALARGIAARGLCDLQHHVEGNAEPTAELSVAAGTGAEFMVAE